ncbi:hypothetical protein Tco_0332284 [Tanacetum coccineum]
MNSVSNKKKLQDSTSNQHQALLSFIYKQNRTNHKDQQTCLFACFLSQEEPKKVSQALADESWVEAMQEELLQFKLQEMDFHDAISYMSNITRRVVTALAAEEEQSTSPHSRRKVMQGMLILKVLRLSQGTANQNKTASVTRTTKDCLLPREVKRLKKQTLSQAKLIIKLKAKLKKLSKLVAPVVKHHALWVENQNLKKQKRRRKRIKKKVSSVKLGRNKGEEILSEEHNVQEEDTTHHFADDTADQDAAVTPDGERKIDGMRKGTITPRTLNFEDEAAAEVSLSQLSRPRGLSIPGPIQSQPQTATQGTDTQALETTNDEEVARKIQAEWDAEEERKRFEELKKTKPKTTLRKPTSLAQERNQMMSFLKGQGYKNLQKLKYPQMKELNYLRVVDFEKNAQDKESLEGISMITELQVIDSPDGEYLIIHRANNHFRAFDTLWEILHVLDRQDLYHLYRVVDDYYEHIPPTGLGLSLLGDLNIIWETAESRDEDSGRI